MKQWPKTRVTSLLNIDVPLIQAGMVWVSGGKLAAAAANAGCLGTIGAGSMKPDLLAHHIKKAKQLTSGSLAVNLPLIYSGVGEQIDTCLRQGIKIFITSAGSPKKWTPHLKAEGCTVLHVCSRVDLAQKCEDAGCDAIILEGYEAGGHNGKEGLTSLILLQQAKKKLTIPYVAAGGFGTGESLLAALMLGADAVQLGTAFMATTESSAHENYKEMITRLNSSPTKIHMGETLPVRLVQNSFSEQLEKMEKAGKPGDELKEFMKHKSERGMHHGDIEHGKLEAGQIVSEMKSIPTCQQLVDKLLREVQESYEKCTRMW